VEPNLTGRAVEDTIPNDPRFGELYGLRNTGQGGGLPGADIKAPQAWDITTGGTRVGVGVLDTGVDYNHVDLYQNIAINQGEIPPDRLAHLTDIDGDGLITFRDLADPINQGVGKITDLNGDGRISGADLLMPWRPDGTGGWADGVDQDGDGHTDDLVGWNFPSNNNTPTDVYQHGTHVSGPNGATGNNNLGVVGVNWVAQITPIKWIRDSGSGDTADAIAAVNYATSLHQRGQNIQLTSNSWRIFDDSPALRAAIDANGQAGL